jgi:hypothetical protein
MKIYLAAPLSVELATELESFLKQARELPDPTTMRKEGADLIIRLTNECLDYYFLRGVEKLGLGLIARQATNLGLTSASTGIAMFVRRIAGSMNAEQIRKLADIVEELILEVPE